jgi:hypothetical protein
MSKCSSSFFRALRIVSIGLLLAACQKRQAPNPGPNPNQQAIQKYQIPSSEEPQISPKQLTDLVRKKIKCLCPLSGKPII